MMLTFLELTHMVDATQHDGVGWGMMLTFLEHIGVKTPQDFLKELQKMLTI